MPGPAAAGGCWRGFVREGSGVGARLGQPRFRKRPAAVWRVRGGDAVPRLRVPVADPAPGRVRDDSPRGRDLRSRAYDQPQFKPARCRQYDAVGSIIRLRLLAHQRAVAADRTALRVERRAADVRGELEWVYNGSHRVRAPLEGR